MPLWAGQAAALTQELPARELMLKLVTQAIQHDLDEAPTGDSWRRRSELLLGYYADDRRLRDAARAGTGITREALRRL
jgi:hypothetical protein